MVQSILVGALLTLVTVGIHTVGTAWWIERFKPKVAKKRPTKHQTAGSNRYEAFRILASTALLLLGLHILEVSAWAITYLLLPDLKSLDTLEQAVYFSTVTFTSLGYGDIVIEGPWRLLSAIEAMVGLMIFGWSTALYFAVVQRIWFAEGSGG